MFKSVLCNITYVAYVMELYKPVFCKTKSILYSVTLKCFSFLTEAFLEEILNKIY